MLRLRFCHDNISNLYTAGRFEHILIVYAQIAVHGWVDLKIELNRPVNPSAAQAEVLELGRDLAWVGIGVSVCRIKSRR